RRSSLAACFFSGIGIKAREQWYPLATFAWDGLITPGFVYGSLKTQR
ncbi:unnamed protein product, partial [Ectocarpus sp. 8 AP-2014]